jgi:hypothetical protein
MNNLMYKVQCSEQNRERSSEYETKSLLYLLAIHNHHSQIDLLIIDFFNDLTGANESCDKLWDVQSKGVKTLNPKKIGQSLFTLYKNSISDISFYQFILFTPKLKGEYVIDPERKSYKIDNFKTDIIKKIKAGLVEENNRRDQQNQINNSDQTLTDFISKVLFVVDYGSKSDYIKKIISFRKKENLDEDLLVSIFDEICDKQASLKNKCIEGVEVSRASEALGYNRHITKEEIIILSISRIIGGADFFSNRSIPISFKDEVSDLDHEDTKDLIIDCNEKLWKAFFNKNNKRNFWKFIEQIVNIIKENQHLEIRMLYNQWLASGGIIIPPFDEKSTLYFISLIKEGIENAN